jgi:hypothetical protein
MLGINLRNSRRDQKGGRKENSFAIEFEEHKEHICDQSQLKLPNMKHA